MRRTNTAKWDEKNKRWKIYVQKDNVRKTFYSSTKGKEGQREANAKADNWLENNITDTKLKVRKTVEKYMEQLRLTSSQSHWKQYDYYFNDWILPKIGDVRIEKVTEQQLQNTCMSLRAAAYLCLYCKEFTRGAFKTACGAFQGYGYLRRIFP